MNLQQLEYIIAVEKHRHFARAAEACFVTQPTLSMMIQKLEEEIDARIFDRSKHPVVPTIIGGKIIAQAKIVLETAGRIKDLVDEEKGIMQGSFRLGIIPTIAPYFLPAFIPSMISDYPALNLQISEMVTGQLIESLKKGELDGAVLATPLGEDTLVEYPLYHEHFLGYISEKEPGFLKETLDTADILPDRLWLLEEGHCFRSQVIKFCDIKKQQGTSGDENTVYKAGSIETLIRMVDRHGGMTIIPELSVQYLNDVQLTNVRRFKPPVPVREVSLVTRKDFLRVRMVAAIREVARKVIPLAKDTMSEKQLVVSING